jgi:hypothetical protein
MTRRHRYLVVATMAIASACAPDPVHDRAVERLGDETAAGPSEFHRAGQPCATCHNAKNGPAQSDFSVAGTIFAKRSSLVGLDGATVELVDSAGTSPVPVGTNCSGNFWIPRSRWNPVLPIVSVRVSKNSITREMKSPIGGTGSCSDCHASQLAPDPLTKLGAVFVFDEGGPPPLPAASCPVDPVLRTP